MKIPALLATAAILLLASCREEENVSLSGPDPGPQYLDFSNQYWTENGIDPVARWGTGAITGYQQEAWEPWVYALFTPLDTAVLPATPWQDSLVHQQSWIFPNPFGNQLHFIWSQGGAVNLKMVMIDKAKNPLYRASYTSNAAQPSGNFWPMVDGVSFPADSTYRIYFAYSTADHPYFLTQHADMTIYR